MRAIARGALGIILASAMLLGEPAMAQEQQSAPDLSRIEQLKGLGSEEATSFMPAAPSPDLGAEGMAAYRQSLKAYYDYRVIGFQHRQRVFAWQLSSSRIIFGMVIFLVFVGVFFSWLQFRSAMKGGTVFSEKPHDTTFEASTTGLKVSSPVLGVIILALSLAFFYLYLLYVYPIQDSL